ncbi:DUF1684 domain-containing protein [Aestuariibaculum suncheonense]|uniref:DUF1684 domain-containing protein n=1 Tax=Aestuariibaculum suncheonense TaxID=1028745 RepID=A0A8J6Q5T9_9FLAO|nr:DUF1684 domain-containing protein [Aestuariibaculum suncheonense]MBD0834877.1 DUF1684 domain-containing protein [Aestuariibaculum suncheonense]
MKYFLMLFVLVFGTVGCQDKKQYNLGETEFQRELNAEYKDATTSPLKDEDRKTFEGLEFFKNDSTYVVTATLELTPDSEFVPMKTTTSRMSEKRVYGVLRFELKGKSFKLNIYQDKDLMTREGYENYLFLPFFDETSGEDSYGGGRYIDARIPEGNTMVIDFNKAYNPYCAYNDTYSCPIVPRENYLKTRIEAGVKVFKKH